MGTTRLKKLMLGCTVALALFFMIEGLASFVRAMRAAAKVEGLREEGHCEYDADLGWRHVADFEKRDFYEAGTTFTTNSQGFRGTSREYAEEVPPDRYRITFLGDSFTMGYGVDDRKTFAALTESLRPTIESVNMGNGGYGIGQDYLWYMRDGVKLKSDLLVFSVIDDDFRRLTLDSFSGYPKPKLRVENDKIVVDNLPVPDGWASRTAKTRVATFVDSLALGRALGRLTGRTSLPPLELAEFSDLAARIFTEMQRVSRDRKQDFVLVYLPSSPRLPRNETPILRWLHEMTAREGLHFVDLTPDFEGLPAKRVEEYYRPDTHFTAEGNAFVAEKLLVRLGELLPQFPGR